MTRKRYEAVTIAHRNHGRILIVQCTSAQTCDWIRQLVAEQYPQSEMFTTPSQPSWAQYDFSSLGRGGAEEMGWDVFVTLCHSGWMPVDWRDGYYRLRWEGQLEEE
jgi:hypothetical protein